MKPVKGAIASTMERLSYERRAEEEVIAARTGKRNAAKQGGFRHLVLCFEFLERGGHNLTSTQVVILVFLAKYADKHGRCYPSRRKLAVSLGVTERSVSGALRSLIDRKFVEIASRGYGQGRYKSNLYQLRTPGSGWPTLANSYNFKR